MVDLLEVLVVMKDMIDPIEGVKTWLSDARKTEIIDPDAMSIATVDSTGVPNVRIVLLKEIRNDGFVFFTNYDSHKGKELLCNSYCAGVLHWKSSGKQVRFRGKCHRITTEDSDKYFATRPLKSRIAVWASDQSRPLSTREILEERVQYYTNLYRDTEPLRPEYWGGICIVPHEIEFWISRDFRLHDRWQWVRDCSNPEDNWRCTRLFP
jgi:pyridoxamine 5'-phosphate oxidase